MNSMPPGWEEPSSATTAMRLRLRRNDAKSDGKSPVTGDHLVRRLAGVVRPAEEQSGDGCDVDDEVDIALDVSRSQPGTARETPRPCRRAATPGVGGRRRNQRPVGAWLCFGYDRRAVALRWKPCSTLLTLSPHARRYACRAQAPSGRAPQPCSVIVHACSAAASRCSTAAVAAHVHVSPEQGARLAGHLQVLARGHDRRAAAASPLSSPSPSRRRSPRRRSRRRGMPAAPPRRRGSAPCSPTPPVNTSTSSPPGAAAIAASPRAQPVQ